MSPPPIRVLLAGAGGRMGREIARHLGGAEGIDLCAAVDPGYGGENLNKLAGDPAPSIAIESGFSGLLDSVQVLVDVTQPEAAERNAAQALASGVACIIGTSGVSAEAIARLRSAAGSGPPCWIVPNFAIGAVLMMRFAEMAAMYMPNVEIVEIHHDKKTDAPSGTASRTAEMIAAARAEVPLDPTITVTAEGARGGAISGVPVHSLRLPGHVAHQMVLFGAPGESLTIRHDSNDRTCFMAGVEFAVRNVLSQSGLIVGLESALFS